MEQKGKLIIISAPSGCGKSTIIGDIMDRGELDLQFSVSATNRKPREGEVDGVNYHFLTIDVKGGVNVKKLFGEDAISIFIAPPSISELRWRLKKRGSESDEDIEERVGRAEFELNFRNDYDHVVVNDTLPEAIAEIETLMKGFIEA